jgi:tetratricopeptide (TPR) repeat protein
MKATQASLRYCLLTLLTAGAFCVANINQRAQTQAQLPSPTAHINDFANVIDSKTRERLESVLQNFKALSKIDFYVATVENTGGTDLFDFSRHLATQWDFGSRSSVNKSLLLVISVESKSSFTQFSRTVQAQLPEGILGEVTQRMKAPLAAGQFTEALDIGVQLFINSMSQKLGLSTPELDKTIASASVESASPSPSSVDTSVSNSDSGQTRPRFAAQPPAGETSIVKTSANSIEKKASPKTAKTKQTPTRGSSALSNNRKSAPPSPVSDEDEEEEVELTLTLPLDKRAIKLKQFLDTHPTSKARPRAIELLISTYAALGDQKLKNGDPTGVDQLMLVIKEADVNVSDQLFAGVISQIPMNLYLRREQAAAFKAAQEIEAKFGTDPKRLLALATFYLGIERGDEATRLADQVLQTAPDMAEAHRARALGLHLSLRVEEAASEYRKVLEIDPASRVARASLADLSRSLGKPEEALALYTEQLKADPKDIPATTGAILSLLDLGRVDEANNMLASALADDPRNLPLMTGAAYWFAAHGEYDKSLELATKAVKLEPRYTWAQIAAARSFVALKRPLDAERSIRFARQYGKFPTLNYELASVLASMGLYEEAAEVLRESFKISGNEIHTRLGGRFPAANENFIDLLAPERRASIYQNTPADSPANAKLLKDLLMFNAAITASSENQKLDEAAAEATAREFSSGTDNMRAFRQLYAASRLLRNGIAFQTAFELAHEALKNTDAALDTPALTMAVQADEFRELRASAIASGNVPEVGDAPRATLAKILKGRSEDIMGWALFNQAKYEAALDHLKNASAISPNATPAWRTATWHLAIALEQAGKDSEALENYVASYKAGPPDNVRRVTIENLYRKVNGSLEGLNEKIGPPLVADAQPTPSVDPTASKPGSTPEATTTTETASSAMPEKTPTPEPSPSDTPKPESVKTAEAAPTSSQSPTVDPTIPVPSPTAEPTAGGSPTESPKPTEGVSEESLKAMASRLRSIIKITGRVVDANQTGIANVVVVLISPSGSVIASTTDTNGNYSFTVTPSQKTYRVIPSKDGFTFAPIDRAFVGLFEDQKGIDFVGTTRP